MKLLEPILIYNNNILQIIPENNEITTIDADEDADEDTDEDQFNPDDIRKNIEKARKRSQDRYNALRAKYEI